MADDFVNKPIAATKNKNPYIIINPGVSAETEKTIVVLGVERGGTSMGAAIIRAIGVNMGDNAGLNHEDPAFLSDDTEVLKKRIIGHNKNHTVWGFKVPKASLFLPFYEKNLRNPYYVVVYRNVAATVDSWQQRATGSPLKTMDRILSFYSHIQKHLHATDRPVILINYERAVANKQGTVEALANFIGLDADAALIQRGVSMMTGDGKGYVNLPEHFFKVTPCASMKKREPLYTTNNAAELTGTDGWTTFPTLGKKLEFTPKDAEYFPKSFWISTFFATENDNDHATQPLRIYFDYLGKMFPGHCARPTVRHGVNTFFIETNGKAKAVGFGPLQAGLRFKIEPQFFAATDDDGEDLEEIDGSILTVIGAALKSSLLVRLLGKKRKAEK